MNNEQPPENRVPFDRLIAIAAFRYALGRSTYMPSHVAEYLAKNSELLSEHDKVLIVREITEAADRGAMLLIGLAWQRLLLRSLRNARSYWRIWRERSHD